MAERESAPIQDDSSSTTNNQSKPAQPVSVPSNFTSQISSFAQQRHDVIREEEMEEILKLSAQEVSRLTTTSSSTLVQLSNSSESQDKLKELLPVYFYSWNLTTPHSIIIYLLLHFFIVKQDHEEVSSAKHLYEEHIARLKARMGDLEERLTKSSLALATATSGNGNSAGAVATKLQSQQNFAEVFRLRRQVEQLMRDNEQLRKTNEEICLINEQWALDYAHLSDQISNATGFYSNSSTGTHQEDTSHHSKSDSASPVPRSGSSSPTLCSTCVEKNNQLEKKESELTKLECGMESLKCELRETKEKLRQRERVIDRLESDHQAIILQLQEIGDLQQALRVKQEFRKLQHQFSQLKRQQQDTMCEKLHLQKQVEKLRQAFLNLFPFAATQHSSSSVEATPNGGGYSSFPMRTCRRHYQQYPHSDPPPTPPGLIARGDHHGSLVEKDKEHLSPAPILPGHHKYAEQVTGYEKNPRSLGPYDLLYSQHPLTRSTSNPTAFGQPSLSASGQFLHTSSISRTVMPSQTSNTGYSDSFSFSIPKAAASDRSRDTNTASLPHSSTASLPHSSTASHHLLPPTTLPLSISQNTQHQSTQAETNNVTSISMSSGYGSPSPFNHMTQSIDHVSDTGTTQSLKQHAGDTSTTKELKKTGQTSFTSSSDNTSASSVNTKTRPKELFDISGANVRHGDVLCCSNCKKQFKYGHQAFDSWFEHVRFCDK